MSNHHRFSFLDARKLSAAERAVGELMEEGPSFLDDAAEGKLPSVSWIDRRFRDRASSGQIPTMTTRRPTCSPAKT